MKYIKKFDEKNNESLVFDLVRFVPPLMLQFFAIFLITRNMTTEVDEETGEITDWWIRFKTSISKGFQRVKDTIISIPDKVKSGFEELEFQLQKEGLSKDAELWLKENIESDTELQNNLKMIQDDVEKYNNKIAELRDRLSMDDYSNQRYGRDEQSLSPEKINHYNQSIKSWEGELKKLTEKKLSLAQIVQGKLKKLNDELPLVYKMVIQKFKELAQSNKNYAFESKRIKKFNNFK